MKMNKLFLILSVAAAALVAFSCAQKEAPYESGEVENDNPYNIFFDTLKESAFQLDPADPTQLTFKVFRDSGSVAEKLTVPVVLTPAAGSEDIFTLSEVVFPKDSVWTEFTASFPNAEVGKLYSATVAVTDPKFIHIYSDVPKSISFSVQRVKWNSLGKGTYYDDLLAYWSKNAYDPVEVEFLQCDTDHSLFRIMDPYTQILSLIGATSAGGDDDPEAYIQIKVLKKGDKVGDITCTLNDVIDFGQVPTGYVHPSYAEPIYLLHPKYFAAGADPAYWSHSQVVSYQENGLPGEIHLAPYYYMFALGGFNYSQYDDDIDIIFPGFVPTDYTMLLEADYPSGGSTPIYMEVGSDIKSVKYAVYEGTIGEKGAEKKIETITSGEDASTTISEFEYDEDEDIYYVNFDVAPEATGLYTVVAIGYDADNQPQGVGFVNFQFVAEEDEDDYAVSVSVGAEATSSRYEAAGHNQYNSFAYWIAGEDLTDVHVAVVPKASISDSLLAEIKADAEGEYAVDEDVLAEINADGGYATIATKLADDMDYAVIVWATNGNLDDFAYAFYTTEKFPEVWKSLGTGLYTDDFFAGLFDIDCLEWEVEVMQSEDDPTRYKMIYPYDGKYLHNEDGDWDTSRSYDIIINIPDEDHVYIVPQETGVNWGYGMTSICSIAGRYIDAGYTIEDLDGYGITFGTLEDCVITFLEKDCLVSLANYNSGSWMYANTNSAFKLVLPEAADGAPALKSAPAHKPASVSGNAKAVELKVPYRKAAQFDVERTYVPVNAVVTINTERGAKKHCDKCSATIEKF
jgi:hypothetical protein